jgi:hypothetical protein
VAVGGVGCGCVGVVGGLGGWLAVGWFSPSARTFHGLQSALCATLDTYKFFR